MTAIVEEGLDLALPVDPEIEVMVGAGVHMGHSHSKRHPAMIPFVWSARNNTDIIDLTKTKEKLAAALAYLKQAASERKLILFVGTRPSVRDLLREAALELGYPYVDQRWIGGTLTNFRVVRKRIETLEGLEHEKASGGLDKYTKKERLRKEQEMGRLVETFDGLRRLTKLPDVLVILDISHDDLALREATRMGATVISLNDTNTDPRSVTYAIPSNDDARPAVSYMLGRMKVAIREGEKVAEANAREREAVAAAAVAAAATATPTKQ